MAMDKKCIVPSCHRTVTSSDVDWFPFPEQNSMTSVVRDGKTVYLSKKELWMDVLYLTGERVSKFARICPLHFKKDDFVPTKNGDLILKDDAVPCRNPDAFQDSQEKNVNDLAEKSDDDDDVEIIEPPRVIITLDDDDDENQKDSQSAESNLVASQQDTSVKEQETNKNSTNLTCMNPESITHSVKYVINKDTNVTKLEVTTPSTSRTVSNRNGVTDVQSSCENQAAEKSILKDTLPNKLQLQCITANGQKFFISIPKPGTLPTPASRARGSDGPTFKFFNVPEIQRARPAKSTGKTQNATRNGQNSPTGTIPESVKQQLSMLLKRNPTERGKEVKNGQVPSAAHLQNKLIKIVDFPKTLTPYRRLPIDRQKNLLKIVNGNVAQAAPQSNRVVSPQSGPSNVAEKTNVPFVLDEEKQPNETGEKLAAADPGGNFKYVDVDEIIKNTPVKEEPEEDGLRSARDKCFQTDAPVGFAEMYDFIQKNMIDFLFDVFGKRYRLKGCDLHFESEMTNHVMKKKIAQISKSTLTSMDTLLLNGMNTSISLMKQNPSLDARLTKELSGKSEKLSICEEKEKLTKTKRRDNLSTNYRRAPIDNSLVLNRNKNSPNYTVMERDKKIIICPKFADRRNETVTDVARVDIDRRLDKINMNSVENRRIIKRRNVGRPRKLLRVPISSMNPPLRGRLNVDRARFRMHKRSPIQSPKKKRDDSADSKETESEEKATSSTSKDPSWESGKLGDTSPERSPIKTRSSTRGKKKDYRRLSANGTTEDTKKSPIKRKKSSSEPVESKKAKYSGVVGAIESFLEVVLEPGNEELIQNTNATEVKEDKDDNPQLCKIASNQTNETDSI